jgi:RNA polymerase-binding protein DksA
MAQYDEAAVRARLTAERARLQREIYELTHGDRAVQSVDPLWDAGGLKSEQVDDADMVFEAERNQAVVDNAQILLAQVQAALDRLDNGTYGKCVQCGKDINPKRLAALPYATLCIDCQSANEARLTRPRAGMQTFGGPKS